MSTVSLNSLIDQSVDKVPPFRRMVYRSLLANPRVRNAFSVHLVDEMKSEPCCSEIALMAASDEFNGEVTMAINPDNLKAILDFIMKILPILLQIFLKV